MTLSNGKIKAKIKEVFSIMRYIRPATSNLQLVPAHCHQQLFPTAWPQGTHPLLSNNQIISVLLTLPQLKPGQGEGAVQY